MPVTYQISVVNFIFDKDTDKYVSRYEMRTDDGRLLESRQNIIVVELPKIAKLEKTSVNYLTSIEKWCKFLLDADDSEKSGYVEEIASSEEGIMSYHSHAQEVRLQSENFQTEILGSKK